MHAATRGSQRSGAWRATLGQLPVRAITRPSPIDDRGLYDLPGVDEPLDRDRRFVLTALACLVPTMGCVRATTVAPSPPIAFPSAPIPEAVFVLGRRYLAAHPEDADREALRRALGLDPSDSEATQLARIDDALRRDLGAGNVVDLEGWQLTRTECRLCAALALG